MPSSVPGATAARHEVRPRLAVLLSGGGRTLVNLVGRIRQGRLAAEIVCVIADRPQALGLVRAQEAGIDHECLRDNAAIWERIRRAGADMVLLCGYLRLLPIDPQFVGRVLNIHPSLLPAYGGKGMHGHHVHEAVLAARESESGCTVHQCTDEYDRGPIVLQQRVPVLPIDTPDTLAARVFAAECEAYPQAIESRWRELAASPR